MSLPISVYFDFFHDYFTNYPVLAGITLALVAIVGAYGVFRLTKRSSVRTISLLSISAISSFLWLFVISSLIICALMANEYWQSPQTTILAVLRLSLLLTLAGGPSLVLLFRTRAIRRVYAAIERAAIPMALLTSLSQTRAADESAQVCVDCPSFYERSMNVLSDVRDLSRRTDSSARPVSLSILRDDGPGSALPESLAVDWHGVRMIAIKEGVADMLEDGELEGVIAHEMGHIVQRDARAKSIATAFRISFPFDPLVYFAEAAIYRERELAADEYSARLTGDPASLASALLKIYENSKYRDRSYATLGVPTGISFLVRDNTDRDREPSKMLETRASRSPKLLSKQPPLKLRIERLLEVSRPRGKND